MSAAGGPLSAPDLTGHRAMVTGSLLTGVVASVWGRR